MNVCTLIASRGLIHSRTIESIWKNLEDVSIFDGRNYFVISHDKPIPEAQNYLVEEALKTDATHFWFVEEDNTFPEGVLFKMLAQQKPVVALDYPVGEKQYSTIMRKNGKVYWCGLGCTLIEREVFETLDKPWFRNDYSWKIKNMKTMDMEKINVPNKYGGHDINFGMTLLENDIEIYQLPDMVGGHLKGKSKSGTNNDIYTFTEMSEILNYQNY